MTNDDAPPLQTMPSPKIRLVLIYVVNLDEDPTCWPSHLEAIKEKLKDQQDNSQPGSTVECDASEIHDAVRALIEDDLSAFGLDQFSENDVGITVDPDFKIEIEFPEEDEDC